MPINPRSQVTKDHYESQWRIAFYTFVREAVGLWIRLNYRVKIENREKIPPQDKLKYIIVGNHTSLLDPPLIPTMFHLLVAYMAKEELFEHWFLGPVLYNLGVFAVNRKKLEISTIKSAKQVLASEKWSLALFPQGTRRPDQPIGELKRGVTFLAGMAKAPVLPIGIARYGKNNRNIIMRVGDIIPYDKDQDVMTAAIQEALVRLSALPEDAK